MARSLLTMRLRAGIVLLCVAGLAVDIAGCHRNRNPESAASGDPSIPYGLGAADADDRKEAAEKLRKDGGPPLDAVPHVIAAIQRERDGEARAEMLITLGASGSADAKPVLEANLNDRDKDVREGAQKGLKLWTKKTGRTDPALLAKLESPEWKTRRDTADDLREDG